MAGEHQGTQRLRDALAAFGLTIGDARRFGAPEMREHARSLDARLRAGEIALLRGPSGSGKSCLLREFARGGRCVDAREELRRADARGARVIDLFACPVEDALGLLSAAGLADARIPARFSRELSEGQRARLGIGLAMEKAHGSESRATQGRATQGRATQGRATQGSATQSRNTLIIDEFGSGLDDATARSLAAALRKWVDRTGVRVVCAGVREDVAEFLAPEIVVDLDEGGVVETRPRGSTTVERVSCNTHTAVVERRNRSTTPPGVLILRGSAADYARMARLHYRAGRPATVRRVLAARHRRKTIGVLVTSMPTLNGSWRESAWPGFSRGSKREAAEKLNREVRCISRVIVDPAWRGRGVGSALVRAYLADAETEKTEAVSAMGAFCPLFTRAGMTEHALRPTARDVRLEGALKRFGLCLRDLIDVERVSGLARMEYVLMDALRRWARDSGATRGLASGEVEEIVRCAAMSAAGRKRAWTYEVDPSKAGTQRDQRDRRKPEKDGG